MKKDSFSSYPRLGDSKESIPSETIPFPGNSDIFWNSKTKTKKKTDIKTFDLTCYNNARF